MKFDPYAFAREFGLQQGPRAIRATCAIPTFSNSTNSTNSTPKAAQPANAACAEIAPPANVLPFAPSRQDATNRDMASTPEMRRTWTGRIVNMDDWRSLSEWERHGPGERMYCGICLAWVSSFPYCHEVRT